MLLALGCLEETERANGPAWSSDEAKAEGDGVVLKDRLGAVPGEFPEGPARQCPAQSRKVGHLGAARLTQLAVVVDHPGPHVPCGAQEAVTATALRRSGAQGDPGGAANGVSTTHVRKDSEGCRQEKAGFRDPANKVLHQRGDG